MSYASAIAADSPVLWFRFYEGDGLISMSTGSDGTVGLSFSQPFSTNLQFQNVSLGYTGIARDAGGLATVGYGAAYTTRPTSSVTSMTIEAWVASVTPPGPGQSGNAHRLVSVGLSAASAHHVDVRDWTRNLTSSVLDSSSSGHAQNYTGTPGYLSDGHYHHVVLVCDTTSSLTYVDGALVSPAISNGSLPTFASAYTVLLGDPSTTFEIQAGVVYAEVAIYHSVLTSTQIAAHHAAQEMTDRPRRRAGLPSVCP